MSRKTFLYSLYSRNAPFLSENIGVPGISMQIQSVLLGKLWFIRRELTARDFGSAESIKIEGYLFSSHGFCRKKFGTWPKKPGDCHSSLRTGSQWHRRLNGYRNSGKSSKTSGLKGYFIHPRRGFLNCQLSTVNWDKVPFLRQRIRAAWDQAALGM